MTFKITQHLKMLLFSLCFISSFTTQSQTVSHDFKNTINDVFAGIDLNKVPHHLLLDYAMEFVDIRSFAGVANDTNYVHKGIYTSAYNTLLMARTQTNVQDLVSPTQFETNWKTERTAYTIALSGLYYKYERIRPDAHPDAITVNNNKLYDKYTNGVWQNPYETAEVFMMTAPILRYNYKNMQVVLPSNLWYSNNDTEIQSIAIDFNDGNGYQTVTFGQAINVSYATQGTYDWDYKVTLNNSQVLYSHSKLIVGDQTAPLNNGTPFRLPSEPCIAGTSGTLVNGFDQVEFQGSQLFNGFANSATIQIVYASGDPCDAITKPLIVAEGFESGLLGNENPLGDNNIRNFILEANNQTGQLGVELANYDIIYINWDQGRDDLRRNALLLEDIITWVNSVKTAGAPQNVVLGQSMGGVVARYALADMEQNPNLNHDTSLYISHDAPHQGANIPISIQYFARHLADEFVSTPVGDFNLPASGGGTITLAEIETIFNDVGTRQLIANNINGNFQLDNSAFDTWQTELQAKGYPQLTRNIAISNGSHCANLQQVQPLDELLFLSGDIEPTILLDAIINYFPLLSFAEGLGYVGLAIILEDPAYLAGLLPGRTNLNARFDAKALPNVGQSANIYKGRIRITKKINFVFFTLTYNINITDREYNNPGQVQLPLDSYPGGENIATFDLTDFNTNQNNNGFINLNLTGRSNGDFNFISTTTALDVGGGSSILNDADYREVYTAGNPPIGNRAIPFDNFTTSFNQNGINERHISFNTRNGDWLALELNDIFNDEDFFDCSFVCNENSELIGPDELCDIPRTYTAPTGASTYSWNVFPNDAVNFNATNTNTLTVSRSSNSSGWIIVQVVISDTKCSANGTTDFTTFSKDVYLGAPIVETINVVDPITVPHISRGFGQCQDIGLELDFSPNNQDVLDVEWEKITTDVQWSRDFNQPDDRFVILYPDCNQDFEFRVRARNSCGWSDWQDLVYTIDDCAADCSDDNSSSGSIDGTHFQIYPVPADTDITVKIKAIADGVIDPNLNFNIKIFNGNGVMVRDVTSSQNPTTINIANLPSGTYTVIPTHNGNTESHQVIFN